MTTSAEIRRGEFAATFEASTGCLVLRSGQRRLPWRIDLRKAACVRTRKVGSSGPGESHPIRLELLTPRRISPARCQWIGEVGSAGVVLEIALCDEGLALGISPIGTGSCEVVSAVWPGPIVAAGPSREVCWGNNSSGAMFRPDGKPWRHAGERDMYSMRLWGLSSGGQAIAGIVDTPVDALLHLEDDGASELSARIEWQASMGTLAYARRLMLVPLEEAGHVAVAGAFRQYLQRSGLWKPWAQRVEENPAVERLKGAFVACAGYFYDDGADHVAVCRKMRQMGFERGYLFSSRLLVFDPAWYILGQRPNNLSDETIRQVQDMGYLCASFLQVEEATDAIGDGMFALEPDGGKMLRWQVGERKYWEIAKWRIPAMLARFDTDMAEPLGAHFDTLTAAQMAEHHGARSYDRRGDAAFRLEIARYYRQRGKVIAAEAMRDWATPSIDMFTSRNPCPVYADPRVWTCPLSDLVYHDSLVRTVWEHDSYNDDECAIRSALGRKYHYAKPLSDLLVAAPPVLFPEGLLYYYGLEEITLPDGRKDFKVLWDHPAHLYRKRFDDPLLQAALPKALRICQLNMRHGTARMTAHRFIDPRSPMVQESEFETGLRVIVNYGDEPYALADGKTVPARGTIVEE